MFPTGFQSQAYTLQAVPKEAQAVPKEAQADAAAASSASSSQAVPKEAQAGSAEGAMTAQQAAEFVAIQKLRYGVTEEEHEGILRAVKKLNSFTWTDITDKSKGLSEHWDFYYEDILKLLRAHIHDPKQVHQLDFKKQISIDAAVFNIVKSYLPGDAIEIIVKRPPLRDLSISVTTTSLVSDVMQSLDKAKGGLQLIWVYGHILNQLNCMEGNFQHTDLAGTGMIYLKLSTSPLNTEAIAVFKKTIEACIRASDAGKGRNIDLKNRYDEAKNWEKFEEIKKKYTLTAQSSQTNAAKNLEELENIKKENALQAQSFQEKIDAFSNANGVSISTLAKQQAFKAAEQAKKASEEQAKKAAAGPS